MKKFKNHQRPRRKYRFNIVGHKKALKIWWDSPFNVQSIKLEGYSQFSPSKGISAPNYPMQRSYSQHQQTGPLFEWLAPWLG